jgi:plastocyanin domain-containing protein
MKRSVFLIVLCLAFAGCEKPHAKAAAPPASSGVQEIQLAVTDAGFQPAEIAVAKDRPIRLTVTRKTDQTCAREIVFKEIAVKQDLPLNQAVTVDLPAQPGGTLHYACGMNMIKGALVVQ